MKGYKDSAEQKMQSSKRADAYEKLKDSVSKLSSSEDFTRWLKVRAQFHKYSLNNTLLLLGQFPTATKVAGYQAWKKLGRQVCGGEKGIQIFAPLITRKKEEKQKASEQSDTADRELVGYRVVNVFDISQTEGDPLPDDPVAASIEGNSHAYMWDALVGVADEAGYEVETQSLNGNDGFCVQRTKKIVVKQELSGNGKVHVLIHELAHAYGAGYKEFGRKDAEVVAEAASYIVCAGIGLDVSSNSVPYIARWSSADTEKLLDVVSAVDEIARKIENAIAPADEKNHPKQKMQVAC